MNRRVASGFIAALVMLLAGGVALVAAQGGGRGGDVLLSTFEYHDSEAAVAYNSHAQEFLVVWSHEENIYGQRYDWQGLPQGENFPISITRYGKYWPAAAYSLSADSYLVVWEDYRNGNDYDIYGQLVDADGTLLDNPSTPEIETDPEVNFAVYTGPGNQEHPDLDFDGSNYLVVWQGPQFDDSVDVCGRFVRDNGTVEPVFPIAHEDGVLRQRPAVAYNATANEYLVVFQYDEDDPAEIHGRRVQAFGAPVGAEYTIADQAQSGDPDVAAAAWGAYVVVWPDRRVPGESNIYGRVVLAGADNSFDGDDFPICTANANQFYPAIARSPSTGQFLVVWDDGRETSVSGWNVYAQRLLADANLAGSNFAISTDDGDQRRPAIAASQGPDLYFIAWEDTRGGYDIYGQRVAWTGSLVWYQFAISAQPGAQEAPAITYNGATGEYVAVWQDGSGAIYGRRLSAAGQPLTEPWVIANDERVNLRPDVGCKSNGNCLVFWRDDEANMLGVHNMLPTGAAYTGGLLVGTEGGDNPRLAYDELNDLFLLVWESEGKIYAAPTEQGKPTAQPIAVWPGNPQSRPDVAFDALRQAFVVVWEEQWPTNTRIYGSLVVVEGGVFPIPSFPIAGEGDTISRHRPAVAYNADAGEYLVVYEYLVGTKEADIHGQRMVPSVKVGDEIVIRAQPAGADQFAPDVVYVPAATRYSVIWSEYQDGTSGNDLYGRWLQADGGLATTALPFFRYPGGQQYPRLAYDPDHAQGMVVWKDTRRNKAGDVCARLGALDLEPPTARFTRDPTVGRPGTTFTFNGWPSSDNLTPRGALAVRWDWTSDGSWDTNWSLGKYITKTINLPGVYTVTLEVRDLMWYTDTVSHAITVRSASGNTPPTATLTVTPLSGTAGTVFTLDASGSSDAETPGSLQVRWDWEDDGEWDTDFSAPLGATHAYTMAGDHTVRAEVRDAEGLTDATARSFLVQPGAVVRLEVAPADAKVLPQGTIQFRATAWDAHGNEMSNPSTAWSVRDPQAGTIDANGVFTASMQAGTYPDVILAQSERVTARASVTIVWPYQIYLPLTVKG